MRPWSATTKTTAPSVRLWMKHKAATKTNVAALTQRYTVATSRKQTRTADNTQTSRLLRAIARDNIRLLGLESAFSVY
jgi:hypothetical protein